MASVNDRAGVRAQFSPLGVAIGCIGCVVITASSVYTALKAGSLPWPTIFTSITALILLRACGHSSLHEANTTQVIMSAGAMVAGGLAFTIPGAWMLGLADEISIGELLFVAISGTLLGLVCTALIRRRFIDESDLEYPIGTAAAQTLLASDKGGSHRKKLFASLGCAGLYTLVRDWFHLVPSMLFSLPIPGVSFGIYNSPMMLSVGFLVGAGAVTLQLVGSLFSNFGLVVGGSALGLWDTATASGIVKSLGMGLMMGSGIAVVLKDIVPTFIREVRQRAGQKTRASQEGAGEVADDETFSRCHRPARQHTLDAGLLGLFVAAAALLICFGLQLGPVIACIVVVLSFITTIMSAQSVGQTGIDPMEIFGLIVLLVVAAVSDATTVKLFYIAAIVAVTCGLAGDIMSDFKVGALVGTHPRAMWIGQVIGSLLGAVVAVVTLCALVAAYGPQAFGPGNLFVSAQASVVATMVSGIPSVAAFVIGLCGGIILYFVGLPSMMFGLGVYLPMYMSLSMFAGCMIKVIMGRIARTRQIDEHLAQETGLTIASGLLGGESIVGVIIALISVVSGLAG